MLNIKRRLQVNSNNWKVLIAIYHSTILLIHDLFCKYGLILHNPFWLLKYEEFLLAINVLNLMTTFLPVIEQASMAVGNGIS